MSVRPSVRPCVRPSVRPSVRPGDLEGRFWIISLGRHILGPRPMKSPDSQLLNDIKNGEHGYNGLEIGPNRVLTSFSSKFESSTPKMTPNLKNDKICKIHKNALEFIKMHQMTINGP